MCLYIIKSRKPQIATKPITVYKVIYRRIELAAPYQGDLYGYLEDLPIKLEDKYPFKIIDGRVPYVTSGGFHSLAYIENAKILTAVLNGKSIYIQDYYKIFECTIPVGAEYYEGYFNGWKAYCSKQLIIEKPCV